MIRRAVVGSLLIPALACASVDGADQGRTSMDGDASSGSGATHTGGSASGGGGGSIVSGGAAGASGSTTAPPDLPCDCTHPCPLNCELREELKPSHRSAFDWPCGKARDDGFLLECYRPTAVDDLLLFRRCDFIGVRHQGGFDRRVFIDWYDADTLELVGWEVTDINASPTQSCYGAMPPPECGGPWCTVICNRPGQSCSLSDLATGDASTGDLDAAMSGGG
jgi:hypothetical protein